MDQLNNRCLVRGNLRGFQLAGILGESRCPIIISIITGAEPIEKILGHLREKGIDPRAGPFVDTAV